MMKQRTSLFQHPISQTVATWESIVLSFWLLGCVLLAPTRWRQYLEIDTQPGYPTPKADFAFAHLQGRQWQLPAIQALAGAVGVAIPLVIFIVIALFQWIATGEGMLAVRAGIYAAALSFAFSLFGTILVSAAFGIVGSVTGGLLLGLSFTSEEEGWEQVVVLGDIFVLSLASSALVTMTIPDDKAVVSSGWKIFSGIFAGIGIPALILTLCVVLVTWIAPLLTVLASSTLYVLSLALGIGLILSLFLEKPLWAWLVAAVFFMLINTFLESITELREAMSIWQAFTGGLSNGLILILIFAMPYVVARQISAKVWVGVISGLFASVSLLLVLLGFVVSVDVLIKSSGWLLFLFAVALSQRGWPALVAMGGKIKIPAPFHHNSYFYYGMQSVSRITEHSIITGRYQFAKWFGQRQDGIAPATTSAHIDNPYMPGRPLTTKLKQTLFKGRDREVNKIKHMLVHGTSVILYGQKRIGKTSLLLMLEQSLNEPYFTRTAKFDYVVFFIDLQDIYVHTHSTQDFIWRLYGAIVATVQTKSLPLDLPVLSQDALSPPFGKWLEWLASLEQRNPDKLLILAIDEFEILTALVRHQRLEHEIEHAIYLLTHREGRIRVVISASSALQGDYLRAMSTVRLGRLSEVDARQLVEQPYPHFPLCYEATALRKILDVADGHPDFLQALCREVVELLNEENEGRVDKQRFTVTLTDVEKALSETLESTSSHFGDLVHQSWEEQQILQVLAQQGDKIGMTREALRAELMSLPDLDVWLAQLVAREIVELDNDSVFRFKFAFLRYQYLRT